MACCEPAQSEARPADPDAGDKLAELYRQRDSLAGRRGAPHVAALNYGHLVQQVVPAADVPLAPPDEASVTITLSKDG